MRATLHRRRSADGVRIWAPWLILAAAVFPHLVTLGGEFVYDDHAIIEQNPVVSPATPWWASLTESYWPEPHAAGLYRPVTTLTYRLQRSVWPTAALPFHAVNLLLHAAASLLVWRVMARLWAARATLAVAVALLFAVHPLHSEAVANVVGRAELLAATGGLGAYLLWLRRDPRPLTTLASGLLFTLAAGSKESAFAWLGLIILHRGGLFGDRRGYRGVRRAGQARWRAALRADAALLLGAAAYLAARRAALGAWFGLGDVSLVDNPLAAAEPLARVLSAFKVLAYGVGLTFAPLRLRADYSWAALRLETTPVGVGGLALLVALVAAVIAWRLRRRHPIYLWAGALFGTLMLPVSNLLVPIGTIMAERLFYLPLLGPLAAAAAAIEGAVARHPLWRRAAIAGLAALLLFFALGSAQRDRVWRDDRTLFATTVADQPRSAKARVNWAALLAREHRWEEAEAQYRAALEIAADYPAAWTGLGHVLLMQGALDRARRCFKHVLAATPRHVEAAVRLGNLELEAGAPREALAAFERAIAVRPSLAAAWIGKASALYLAGRYAEAATAWERAAALAPPAQDVRPQLAAAYRAAGRQDEARVLLDALVEAYPARGDLAARLARLQLDMGAAGRATVRLARRAVAGAPTATHLGLLLDSLLALGDCDAARRMLTSAEVVALDAAARQRLAAQVAAQCPPGENGDPDDARHSHR